MRHDDPDRQDGTDETPLPSAPSWLPDWVASVAWPVWVCDPQGLLVFVNEPGLALLGIDDWQGRRCHDVVRGYGNDGREICHRWCRLRSEAARGNAPEPLEVYVGAPVAGRPRVAVLPLVLHDPDHGAPHVVHCAIDLGRVHRAREYLLRVASRSARPLRSAGDELTARERQVLALLAQDMDPATVADHLHLSPTTVRNHVQHVLEKLGVHSTEEAVARWILGA